MWQVIACLSVRQPFGNSTGVRCLGEMTHRAGGFLDCRGQRSGRLWILLLLLLLLSTLNDSSGQHLHNTPQQWLYRGAKRMDIPAPSFQH